MFEGIYILSLEGEINISSLAVARRKVESSYLDQYSGFIIDLADVSFFDSAGLGFLMHLIRQARRNNVRVAVCSANNLLKRLFATVGIEQFVDLYESRVTAQQALEANQERQLSLEV